MKTVFISPSRYIQGPGELENLGTYTGRLGKKAFCLLSPGGQKRMGALIRNSFEIAGISVETALFNGECCRTEIRRLVQRLRETACDTVVGLGGGRLLDTAKAVAFEAGLPLVICPTSASSDAPCSALSVLHNEGSEKPEFLFYPKNPDLVLADSAIIAGSPLRMTVSGMADAMATYIEARAARKNGGVTCAGGLSGLTALGIARLCYDILLQDGRRAAEDLREKRLTEAVEHIIEANILMSGLGFESGGVAGAHALHNAMSLLPECETLLHGEKVNFGILTQLFLEQAPEEECETIIQWMLDLGLPVTFEELGIRDTGREHLLPVAAAACAPEDTMKHVGPDITGEKVYAAMLQADAYGRRKKKP